MKTSVLVLGLATAAFAGSIAARALPPPVPQVNDAAVMDGMPRALSQFGFFTDQTAQQPAAEVRFYRLKTPLYSDGADKLRFIYSPAGTQFAPNGDGLLEMPVGTAIIKTFAFGEGDARRLIETRVLLHRTEGWVALPYRWNEDQSDAVLALAGARIAVTRPDGAEISYRIPNKNQCKTCHSKDGEVIPIGPKARNLPREWLSSMFEAGHLSAMPAAGAGLPEWADRADRKGRTGQKTADLARAYLDVNCAHCHQPGGGASNSGLDLRWEQQDPAALGIGKPPVAAGRGAGGHSVSIAPGDPDASILVYRMKSTEAGVAMPELGRSTTDEEGLAIVKDWIEGMPAS
ncbi:SO2930 family diheme c-type cytochrome [Erythrobacter sp. MTPC3]|uniref:SO2930 family diheme c-type cytochrome n=1 Tax=Erythrobacter sp. MTPC3 TaxID=3056564 RepID=UPI0036F3436A